MIDNPDAELHIISGCDMSGRILYAHVSMMVIKYYYPTLNGSKCESLIHPGFLVAHE